MYQHTNFDLVIQKMNDLAILNRNKSLKSVMKDCGLEKDFKDLTLKEYELVCCAIDTYNAFTPLMFGVEKNASK
ncbi:MAG: hypothetical protein HFF02_08980 [Erysipelotrichaceae bacterium]|nr:hypothetical protein [Erysipelotrichaceae bacterium]